MRRVARAALGIAVWSALPLLARRGIAAVASPREVLDPMVPVGDRLIATGSAVLLAVWLAATGLVASGPVLAWRCRRGRRGELGSAAPVATRLGLSRGWILAVVVGGAALVTRAPVAAAAPPTAAEIDAVSDADRARDHVGAISVLTCGLVASAVLTRLHRARLRVRVTTVATEVSSSAVEPSISATEVRLRRHASPDPAVPPGSVASMIERDAWSAVPIGIHGDAPVTLDCAAGGVVVIEAPTPSLEVAAGVVTAFAGACGFACDVEVGEERLRAMPSLVPVRLRGDLGGATVVRVTRRVDARVVDVCLVSPTASAAGAHDAPGAIRALGHPAATLREADGVWRLIERDLVVRPYRLSAADATGVARLEAAPTGRVSSRRWAPPSDWRVLVRTMGPVSVELADGSEVRFARPKSIELLAWLTHHRERPTRTAARTALWAVDVSDATVANVVSDARRSLARATDAIDVDWIDRTYTERLAFDRRIVSDVDLLDDACRAAAVSPDVDTVARLDAALALVRDLPFAGSDYLWPDEEGLTSHAVHLIISAARRSAQWHLDRGDAASVVMATGHGLRALRGDEDLLALRARAMHLDGRRGGLSLRAAGS